MSHTKGPWRIEDGRSIVGDWEDGETVQVCAMNRTHWSEGSCDWQAKNDRMATEAPANACLISAAPELLEALKRLLPLAQATAGAHSQANYDRCLPSIKAAEHAIEKAEGRA